MGDSVQNIHRNPVNRYSYVDHKISKKDNLVYGRLCKTPQNWINHTGVCIAWGDIQLVYPQVIVT